MYRHLLKSFDVNKIEFLYYAQQKGFVHSQDSTSINWNYVRIPACQQNEQLLILRGKLYQAFRKNEMGSGSCMNMKKEKMVE